MELQSNRFYPVHGKDLNSSNSYHTQRPELTPTRKLVKMTGSLEIIDGEGCQQFKSDIENPSNSRPSSSTSIRSWSRGSVGYAPRTDSSMSRRIYTPTKQISLQAVRRKEESCEPFIDQVGWQSFGDENSHLKIWDLGTTSADTEPPNTLVHADSHRLESVDETFQHAAKLSLLTPDRVKQEDNSEIKQYSESASDKALQSREMNGEDKHEDEKNNEENDGDDDDDTDSSDEDEEKLRAPNELLMEFVDCLMRKDFQTASKLCQMILLYEPDNPEALKFQPLIEERLVLDAEAEEEEEEEQEEDDDSDDDDSDSDDEDGDSDDDEDSSSSNDDLPDKDDNAEVVAVVKEGGTNNNNNNSIHFGSHFRSCHH